MFRWIYFMVLCGIAVPAQTTEVQGPLVVEKPRLLFLDLTATLVELEEVKVLTKLIGTQLDGYSKYAVITSADLRQMAALEAEKQKAFGCADSSCLAELAGAMGTRFIIFGDVGRLGSKIILTLNLFDSKEAKAIARGSLLVEDLGEIPEQIPKLLDSILLKPKSVVNYIQEPVANDVKAPVVINIIEDKDPVVRQKKIKKEERGASQSIGDVPAIQNSDHDSNFYLATKYPVEIRFVVGSILGVSGLIAGLWGMSAYTEVLEKESLFFDEAQTLENRNNAARAQEAYMDGPVWGMWGGGIMLAGAIAFYSWAWLEDSERQARR